MSTGTIAIPDTEPSRDGVTLSTAEQASPSERASPKPNRARRATSRLDRAGQVIISGYFPAETRRRLKIIAARQDKTLQQVMAEAFETWLRRHEKDA